VAGITASSAFPESSPLGSSPGGVTDVFVVVIHDEGDQVIPPPPGTEFAGSYKKASQMKLGPNETLEFTIGLHNSSSNDGTVTVVDELPTNMEYVASSVTGGGTYDDLSRTITWENIAVPGGGDVLLTFEVTADVEDPEVVVNTAVITPDEGDAIERSAAVLLLPYAIDEDVIPPVMTSLQIGDQDVLTDNEVILHINAFDNEAVTQMYIKEWCLNTTPIPHWEEVLASGWVPFDADYPWTLTNSSGTHYVGVWVADEALNESVLTGHAIDYASLLLADTAVAEDDVVPYLVHFEAGAEVTATLTPSSGDADLYVWYPHSLLAPDQESRNPGTAVDTVTFTAPTTGAYLFLVHGYTDAVFDLSITPGGGHAALAQPEAANAKSPGLTANPVLGISGVDPLAVAASPASPIGPYKLYLPVVVK
jgi:uncharacterized repeat protein (TIGR01451 family)